MKKLQLEKTENSLIVRVDMACIDNVPTYEENGLTLMHDAAYSFVSLVGEQEADDVLSAFLESGKSKATYNLKPV